MNHKSLFKYMFFIISTLVVLSLIVTGILIEAEMFESEIMPYQLYFLSLVAGWSAYGLYVSGIRVKTF